MNTPLSPPPLRRALTFTISALIGAAFVLVTVLNVAFHETGQADRAQTESAREILDRAQQTVAPDLVRGDVGRAARTVALYGTHADLQVLVATDGDGKVLMSTRFADRGTQAAETIRDYDPAAAEQVRATRRLILRPAPDGDALVGYAPLVFAPSVNSLRPDTAGVLYLRYDLKRARAFAWREALSPTYWASTLIAVIASSALLLTLLNYWVSRPLRHLGARVSRLAHGDLDVVSDLRGDSEIARLGRDFNDMSRQISASRQALVDANRELEHQVEERTRHLENEITIRIAAEAALQSGEQELRSVLEALGEGVALWDSDGLLRFANPAFNALCKSTRLVAGETRLDDLLGRLSDPEGNALTAEGNLQALLQQQSPTCDHALVRLGVVDGPTRWFNLACAPIGAASDGARPGLVVSLTDVTELQAHSESLSRIANFDRLTGLPNRNLLADRMRVALAHNRRSGREAAVCYLDLDGFKQVNDRYGHDAGDELLRQAAQRLLAELRSEDTVARLGGDEFALLLGDLSHRWDCEPVLKRILNSLSEPYPIDEHLVNEVSASIGVTMYPSDDSDPDTLLRHADHAMYVAKRSGKNRFRWFSPDQESRHEAREQTLLELETALRDGQFELYYQPKVNCRTGRVVGAEALIRWQNPILGLLPPVQFLPLIEDSDLAVEVGDWVIGEGLRQLDEWRSQGLSMTLSVNVFVRQLERADFVERLAGRMAVHGCSHGCGLALELTENSALEGVANITGLAQGCRDLGVPMVLDDFGTGYATLDQLLRIPSEGLKIDRRFVHDLLHNPDYRKVVQVIVGLGRSFGRDVTAVGVEELAQVQWLMKAGCDVMQGFYFAPPMPADEFCDWVRAFRPDPAYLPAHPEIQEHADKAGTGV